MSGFYFFVRPCPTPEFPAHSSLQVISTFNYARETVFRGSQQLSTLARNMNTLRFGLQLVSNLGRERVFFFSVTSTARLVVLFRLAIRAFSTLNGRVHLDRLRGAAAAVVQIDRNSEDAN